MTVTYLPRSDGFSQRHVANPGVSKYLKALDKGYNYWRSPVTVGLIRDDILQFNNEGGKPTNRLLDVAIGKAFREFRLPDPVQMLHLNDLFEYDLNIWGRSPGLPWKALGYTTKRDVACDPKAVKSIRWFWHRIKNGERVGAPDCCAFVRSHLSEPPESKVRAIWGYPMTMTMGEAVFAVPLIEAFQQHVSPMAYGYETAVGGSRRVVNEISALNAYYVGVDFSSFDKTCPTWLIEVAFQILLQNVDLVNYRDHGVADARKMVRMWDYIVRYFIHTTIRLANGERYRKHSGVASGSYFTQLIDSIVNYILITWMTLEVTGEYPGYIRVLGDDSIFRVSSYICLDDYADLALSIGMRINVRKSVVSRTLGELTFLGYTLNDGMPTKPHDRWMASLLYPEFPDRNWDCVASRALGLAYACMGLDDAFDNLCRQLVSLRPFDLRLDSNMARMLWIIGWGRISVDIPSKIDFLLRMGVI